MTIRQTTLAAAFALAAIGPAHAEGLKPDIKVVPLERVRVVHPGAVGDAFRGVA